MNREEALELDYAPPEAFNVGTKVELSINVELIINSIFDDFESRLCKNCKWHQEDICVNGDSPLCAEFVDETYGCVLFGRKE